MLGSVLLSGGSKNDRFDKAIKLLSDTFSDLKRLSPDLLIVEKDEDKKSIGISEARKISVFLSQKPFEKKIKAVVIKDAQFLTEEAQASLLKLLEEPPSYALIILLADKEGSLLPTVSSRCMRVVINNTDVNSKDRNNNEGNVRSFGGATTDSDFNLFKLSYEELFSKVLKLSSLDKDKQVSFLENVLSYDCNNPKAVSLGLPVKVESFINDYKKSNVSQRFALEYFFLLHKDALW